MTPVAYRKISIDYDIEQFKLIYSRESTAGMTSGEIFVDQFFQLSNDKYLLLELRLNAKEKEVYLLSTCEFEAQEALFWLSERNVDLDSF